MPNMDNLKGVQVEMKVEVGTCVRKLEEILNWRRGSVIILDKSTVNQLDLKVKNKKIGEGNIYRNEKSEMDLKITKLNN